MEEKKSSKSLFKMSHEEAQEIIKGKKNNEDPFISQIQFSRFANHCLQCEECFEEAEKAGLIP